MEWKLVFDTAKRVLLTPTVIDGWLVDSVVNQ